MLVLAKTALLWDEESTDLIMSVKTLPATSVHEFAQRLLRVADDGSLESAGDYVLHVWLSNVCHEQLRRLDGILVKDGSMRKNPCDQAVLGAEGEDRDRLGRADPPLGAVPTGNAACHAQSDGIARRDAKRANSHAVDGAHEVFPLVLGRAVKVSEQGFSGQRYVAEARQGVVNGLGSWTSGKQGTCNAAAHGTRRIVERHDKWTYAMVFASHHKPGKNNTRPRHTRVRRTWRHCLGCVKIGSVKHERAIGLMGRCSFNVSHVQPMAQLRQQELAACIEAFHGLEQGQQVRPLRKKRADCAHAEVPVNGEDGPCTGVRGEC